jgi:hypothetical protein
MKIICCECQKILGEDPSHPGATSHGYCKECADALLAKFYADHQDDPVSSLCADSRKA